MPKKTTTKTAPVKKPKSNSLLERFAAGENPHKASGGWNKKFAFDAAQEFASKVDARMTPEEVMVLMNQYVALAGWKNPAKALAAKYGLTRYEEPK